MKANKIIYWISTVLVAGGMAMSAFMYLSANPELLKGFDMLGYPVHFMYLLGLAKVLGAIALVVPGFPKIKEWTYAGLAFCFIGATWAHISTHTPFVMPLVFLAILAVSYVFHQRLQQKAVEVNHWATA